MLSLCFLKYCQTASVLCVQKKRNTLFLLCFTLTEKENKDEWFGKTVIYSDHRFAYEEVQDLIETKQAVVSDKHALNGKSYRVDDATLNAILVLDEIGKNLRDDRMKKGAISFDRVEVNFNLNEDKTPESVFFKSSKDANKLIEEFMLLANKQVARFAGKRENLFQWSTVFMMNQTLIS